MFTAKLKQHFIIMQYMYIIIKIMRIHFTNIKCLDACGCVLVLGHITLCNSRNAMQIFAYCPLGYCFGATKLRAYLGAIYNCESSFCHLLHWTVILVLASCQLQIVADITIVTAIGRTHSCLYIFMYVYIPMNVCRQCYISAENWRNFYNPQGNGNVHADRSQCILLST